MKSKSKQYLKGYKTGQSEYLAISQSLQQQITQYTDTITLLRNELNKARTETKTWTDKYNNVVFTMIRGVEQVTGIPLLFPKGAIKQ